MGLDFYTDALFSSPVTDAKGLSNPSEVELLRERVYASLEAYCKQKYPDQQGRYSRTWKELLEDVYYLLQCLDL